MICTVNETFLTGFASSFSNEWEKEEISIARSKIACVRLLSIKFLFHIVRFLTRTFYQYFTERMYNDL